MWETIALNSALSVLRGVIKNPSKREKLKSICLKIFQAIQTAYAEDEDFQI
jgi:hypothetical protein